MKKSLFSIGLVVLTLLVVFSLTTGCAKRATLKEGAAVSQEQQAVSQPTAVAPAPAKTSDDAAAAARERALQEQALREKAAKEAAERAAAERAAAERAKREAEAKAPDIKNALQIPDIHFDFDKYNLKPEAQEVLKKAAPAYIAHTNYDLVVEGHCDERGTAEYNLVLGEKRATEAANFLSYLGVNKSRIKTISYGEEMPLDKGHNEEAWAKNRRAHFVFSPAK
jgi:peptidoglycan-associated lipoprotein